MKVYDCEYTINVKLKNIFIPTEHSPEQLNEKIIEEGKRRIVAYVSGYLFDPEKKIIFEDIKYESKEI